jgi:hypothetical protein
VPGEDTEEYVRIKAVLALQREKYIPYMVWGGRGRRKGAGDK